MPAYFLPPAGKSDDGKSQIPSNGTEHFLGCAILVILSLMRRSQISHIHRSRIDGHGYNFPTVADHERAGNFMS